MVDMTIFVADLVVAHVACRLHLHDVHPSDFHAVLVGFLDYLKVVTATVAVSLVIAYIALINPAWLPPISGRNTWITMSTNPSVVHVAITERARVEALAPIDRAWLRVLAILEVASRTDFAVTFHSPKMHGAQPFGFMRLVAPVNGAFPHTHGCAPNLSSVCPVFPVARRTPDRGGVQQGSVRRQAAKP